MEGPLGARGWSSRSSGWINIRWVMSKGRAPPAAQVGAAQGKDLGLAVTPRDRILRAMPARGCCPPLLGQPHAGELLPTMERSILPYTVTLPFLGLQEGLALRSGAARGVAYPPQCHFPISS